MEEDNFEIFLQTIYYPELEQTIDRAIKNAINYKIVQWLTIGLSAVTAILIGAQQYFDWVFFKFLALCTSVLVSGLATALTTFNFQEKWDQYNRKRIALISEYNLYSSVSGIYAESPDKESVFVQNITTICSDDTIKYPTLYHMPGKSKMKQII